ncbi:UDP-glucose 6-dehydrogenase [Cytospora mali]|uniref:UDP-glucose 6-dehydrogenase n=1 Tax=Cytospora mali TaxID=578113 RepID=A0A194V0V2_CYTMA|nr:UDP-glucose 6-dehydrogenase [Valsa mali var. pyri (nom. inval.)]
MSSTLETWGSGEATPATSPPSSRGESPERKTEQLEAVHRHARSDTITALPSAPSVKNICFVGAGFVGGPTAALIAYHNPSITVNVVDLNSERIAAWNSNHLPIHETGLPKIVRIARDGTNEATISNLTGMSETSSSIHLPSRSPNLFFSTNVTPCIAAADIIFICVNTPTKMYGVGAGASADLGALESATRTIAKNAKSGAVIVEKSTVPCGTARIISDILRQHRPETSFEVLSNPEFLAEGSAVANLMRPDRILIGSSTGLSGLQAAVALRSVYAAWVPLDRILTVNTFSSELTKLIANAMLAQRISSINAVSALCEELGADVEEVSRALGADGRLGPRFLHAGVGFGGSCFEKDILNLAYLARCLHLQEVADYWTSVLDINRYQRERFTKTAIRKLNGTLRGKKVAIFGFAFKDGTNDTRNSVAVHIIAELAAEMPREIAVFDPGCAPEEVEEEIRLLVKDESMMQRIKITNGWRDAVDGASAALILTQWEQFRGTQIIASKKEAAMAPDNDLSGLLSFTEKEPSEMEITEIEKALSGTAINEDEDPLHRLVPLGACELGCKQCARNSKLSGDKDVVDWESVANLMEDHSWVFDGRNVVNGHYLKSLGFKVHSIGKGL